MSFIGKWYGKAKLNAFKKKIDWSNDDIKVMLLDSTYAPDQDIHEFLADVSSFEVSGDGYTSGGMLISNRNMNYQSENNRISFTGDDVAWYPITISAKYAVIYNNTGTNKVLIGCLDFGEERSIEDGLFEIQWHQDGIMWIESE